VTIGASTSERY